MLNCCRGCRVRLEQVTQGRRGFLRASKAVLKAAQVGGDQLVARFDIRSREHRPDIVQWHVQGPEAPDHLRDGDLLSCVSTVAGVRIDGSRD